MDTPLILIVDDEPFNLDYLEQELEGLGYTIEMANNGREAIEKVGRTLPDLILLDIMMPEMDGFEVLNHLKAGSLTREIPVVIISAANSLENIIKGIQLGAEDYLPKPFEPTLLKARISSSLEKKRLRDLEHLYLKSLQNEMEIARDIQSSFLPSEIPQSQNWDIAVLFEAAKEVAGDYYDTFLLEDDNLVCVIGDVCGKGIGAALFMTLFRSLIRATCTSFSSLTGVEQKQSVESRLVHAVNFTNFYVTSVHGDSDMFSTLFIGLFEPKSGLLTYINCGNEPATWLHKVNGDQTQLPPTGPVIGIIADATFSSKQVLLEPGDVIIGFTDGVPDAMNAENRQYGRGYLDSVSSGSFATSSELCRQIDGDIHQFVGSADQFDDITLMVIMRKG